MSNAASCLETPCGNPAACGVCALIARDPAYKTSLVARPTRPGPPRARGKPPVPHTGVGTELTNILKSLGLGESAGCSCKKWQRRMDSWGVAGCREHRAEIEDHLRAEAKKVGWLRTLTAGARAVAQGLILNPTDPAPGLLDEAIRRAECDTLPATAPDPLVAPLRIAPVGPHGLYARPDGYSFNAGMIRFQGRLLLAYRDGWAGSNVHVAELRDDYGVYRSTRLALSHPRAPGGREDPRLFVHGGRLHVAFIGVERAGKRTRTSQLYARLAADLSVEAVYCPEPTNFSRQEPMEKNIVPFSHDGELLAVYQTGPRHVVVRIDGDCMERIADPPVELPWSGGVMRGGAPPVRVGDLYYHWFHGKVGTDRAPFYNVGLSVFEARPPFRVVAMSPRPMLWGSPADNAAHPDPCYAVVAFPCGAILEGGVWRVSMGWNDRGVRVGEWDAAAVDAALGLRPARLPADRPTPDPTAPPAEPSDGPIVGPDSPSPDDRAEVPA